VNELASIPLGIYSGLRKGIKGIFFYYKYGKNFHFWYLYDLATGEIIKNKTRILDYISYRPDEIRVIPDFFEKVYDINAEAVKDIEATYKKVEQRETVDSTLGELTGDKSKKFVSSLIREMDIRLDEYLLDFSEDKEVEKRWEEIKEKLLSVSLTKKRLQNLRNIWRDYKDNHKGWKKLLKDISEFLEGKLPVEKEEIQPYNPQLLKLVTIVFVS
jgi:hypothetical protein